MALRKRNERGEAGGGWKKAVPLREDRIRCNVNTWSVR